LRKVAGAVLEETIAAFETLREAGKIRSRGVSNFDVDDPDEAWRIAAPDRMDCNRVLYHLQERAIEHAVIPWCAAHGATPAASGSQLPAAPAFGIRDPESCEYRTRGGERREGSRDAYGSREREDRGGFPAGLAPAFASYALVPSARFKPV
jgi:aryl-alcohol dehydrogenase-like predicted oxidoreductase